MEGQPITLELKRHGVDSFTKTMDCTYVDETEHAVYVKDRYDNIVIVPFARWDSITTKVQ